MYWRDPAEPPADICWLRSDQLPWIESWDWPPCPVWTGINLPNSGHDKLWVHDIALLMFGHITSSVFSQTSVYLFLGSNTSSFPDFSIWMKLLHCSGQAVEQQGIQLFSKLAKELSVFRWNLKMCHSYLHINSIHFTTWQEVCSISAVLSITNKPSALVNGKKKI